MSQRARFGPGPVAAQRPRPSATAPPFLHPKKGRRTGFGVAAARAGASTLSLGRRNVGGPVPHLPLALQPGAAMSALASTPEAAYFRVSIPVPSGRLPAVPGDHAFRQEANTMSEPPRALHRAQTHDVLRAARDWLDEDGRIAVATVVGTWGSAPVGIGGQMVVAQDGRFEGSVSGGCVEGEVIAEAEDILGSGQAENSEFRCCGRDGLAGWLTVRWANPGLRRAPGESGTDCR